MGAKAFHALNVKVAHFDDSAAPYCTEWGKKILQKILNFQKKKCIDFILVN